jgi:hypothetical protein
MSRARKYELIALKHTIALQNYRREATRLFEEIARLDARIAQITELDLGYRKQLAEPNLHISEYRDVLQIISRLSERREIDVARNEILGVERKRLITILAEKKQQIEKIEESALQIKKEEQMERDNRAEALIPARRQ